MIYKTTELIKREMDQYNFKYMVEEMEDMSVLSVAFVTCNGPHLQINFISDAEGVVLRVYGIVNDIEENKIHEVLRVINECNKEYSFLKFVLDEDNTVNMEFDFQHGIDEKQLGSEAIAIFVYISTVLDEAHYKLMKAILN